MESLLKLGIKCAVSRNNNPSSPPNLHYAIEIDERELNTQKQRKKYFTNIVKAISNHAAKNGGLEHMTINPGERCLSGLHSVARDLLLKAKEQKEINSDSDKASVLLTKVLICGGAVAGGIAGLVFGYNQMAEWTTNLMDSVNNAPYLSDHLVGLTKMGVSVLGTAVTTAIGAIVGGTCGAFIGIPCCNYKTNLVNNTISKYKSLELALSPTIKTKLQ